LYNYYRDNVNSLASVINRDLVEAKYLMFKEIEKTLKVTNYDLIKYKIFKYKQLRETKITINQMAINDTFNPEAMQIANNQRIIDSLKIEQDEYIKFYEYLSMNSLNVREYRKELIFLHEQLIYNQEEVIYQQKEALRI